jgi:sialidase-1
MIWQLAAITLSQPLAVFSASTEGFHTYRIPSLLKTSKGALIALAEGRQSQSDAAGNQIVMRVSQDDGRRWSPMQVLAKMDGSLNNPCLVESKPGRLVLHFQFYPAGTHEYDVPAGYQDPRAVRAYQMESQDGGKVWTAPRDITTMVKSETASTLASGPGVGILLERGRRKGRILMPYNQRVGQGSSQRWTVYVAYSDDQGKTWRRGATADQPRNVNANEVQLVELAEGGVMLNARNQAADGQRGVAVSHDQGETFSRIELDTRLIDPVCQGSIVRLAWPKMGSSGAIAFSNPSDAKARRNGQFQISYDEGRTWSRKVLLEPESFQYSCLARLNADQVGILYEKVEQNQYQLLYRVINWN